MSRPWSVSDEVLAVFHRCTARERQRLDHFQHLAAFPENRAHYFDRGSDGRLYSVAQFEPWIITYWVDPDGRVVRIIDLELVA